MAQIALRGVKWFPLLMMVSVVLSAGVPYFCSVGMKLVPPFIPFIRHAAAYPPQSGFFNIFLTIASFLGILNFSLRYAVVKSREYAEGSGVGKLNGVSFLMGLLLNFCLVYTSLNPLGFQAQGKEKWIYDVLIPNHVAALSVCLGFTMYVLIQAYVTYQQKRVARQNVFIHAILATSVVVSAWTAIIPLSSSLRDEIRSLREDRNHLVRLEYKEYGFYSTICALSEWSFMLFSILFILSFYKDFKQMNVRLQLQPKHVTSNGVELHTLRQQSEKEITKI